MSQPLLPGAGMPILGHRDMLPIPWPVIAPHAAQAEKNHYQSLATLASRGGLSPCEACAVLEDRPWHPMDQTRAIERLAELIAAASHAR